MYTYIINKNIITIYHENQSQNGLEYATARLKFEKSLIFKKTELLNLEVCCEENLSVVF